MELSKQSWTDIMAMPVNKLQKYLKWKSEFEEEKRKQIEEEQHKIELKQKRW
jgi:hypothetical protein